MTQKELPIYGMSRLGQLQLNLDNEFEAQTAHRISATFPRSVSLLERTSACLCIKAMSIQFKCPTRSHFQCAPQPRIRIYDAIKKTS
jgi:hypothetical protein